MSELYLTKKAVDLRLPSNLINYQQTYESFNWEQAALDGLPNGRGLNIAYEAVDRHVQKGHGEKAAIRWLGKDGTLKTFTYKELLEKSNQVANLLKKLGIKRGEHVFSLTGRVPELYFTVLGSLKNQNVFCSLFSVFGPEPIATRLSIGKARVLITNSFFYQKKIAQLRSQLPDLEFVLLTDAPGNIDDKGILSFHSALSDFSTDFEIPETAPETPALLHFTSGTTGRPKGAVHVHQAVQAHAITGKYVLDLHPEELFWCTADPGWVTGVSYGIISPLVNRACLFVDEGEFDVERWYHTIESQKISIWYTAPTAIRMMMKSGLDVTQKFDFSSLRLIFSVGEPLNAEAVKWGVEAFGHPIHDTWWQTETGAIMLANFPSVDIKPGSMGKPIPGIEAWIQKKTANAYEEAGIGEQGELALKQGFPSLFRSYLNEEERFKKCFWNDFYLTGDLARKDRDGYFWFIGRSDDVIKSAGHLIGPFEVESALMEHPAVAEAAVIGKPDPVIGEVVKAFVSLKRGYTSTDQIKLDILGFARKRLGPAVAPKEIDILDSLPKTRSGKTMRRLLKARELGLPEGDTSMLEN